MLKTSLALCAIVVLAGCGGGEKSLGGAGATADSPIIVSDGSTHLKHNGAGTDFEIVSNGNNTFSVTVKNFTVSSLDCSVGFGCSKTPTQLDTPWTLATFDVNKNPILTIGSTDNQTVTGSIYTNDITSKTDGSGDEANGGTDLIQPATLQNATLTIGNNSTNLTCPNTPCKLKILHP